MAGVVRREQDGRVEPGQVFESGDSKRKVMAIERYRDCSVETRAKPAERGGTSPVGEGLLVFAYSGRSYWLRSQSSSSFGGLQLGERLLVKLDLIPGFQL